MDARVAVPLGILAVAFALPFAFDPAIFFAWSLTLAGLYLLSREPAWRRAARIATLALAAFFVVGLAGAGLVLGWRDRTLVAFPTLPGEEWFVNVLMACGILATGVLLLFAPDPRTRRVARWAALAGALLLIAMALVAAGERVAGLVGLFGAITLALVAAALLLALASTSAAESRGHPAAPGPRP